MSLPNNHPILQELGLTENEAQVYLAFLANPDVTAASIARKLDMDKSSCYRAVESLTDRQLLLVSPKKRGSTYQAVDPRQLRNLLSSKRQEIELQSRTLDAYVDRLLRDHDLPDSYKTNVRIERGEQAVKKMMLDRLESEPSMIRETWMSGNPIISSPEYESFVRAYAKVRIKKGIFLKGLYDEPKQSPMYPELLKSSNEYLKEVRLWPSQELTGNKSFTIYSEKVSFLTYREDDIVVITIHEPLLAELMREMFDYIWKRSEELN